MFIRKAIIFFLVLLLLTPAMAAGGKVHQIDVDAPIHPASMRYIQKAIERAEDADAEAILIRLDTPGGLVESMRGITKAILNSKVPVIVYVGPEGARAGSAGVFITLSAHVAAMAPGTNIGAATPVGIGGKAPADTSEGSQSDSEAMRKKITNDTAAQARALAERRGRNAEWAEDAVINAVSVTATEALKINVIDLIAENVNDLLEKIDGDTIEVDNKEWVLKTKDAEVIVHEMTWREEFLHTLANPNLAYLLMMLGMYGLIFELYHPGAVIPGVVGVIALILAFFAFQTLPLNWAGLLLIIVAVAMFILEMFVTSFGFLTLGGVVSLTVGSIMLFDSPIPELAVSWKIIIPTVVATVLFFGFALTMALRAQKKKVTTGFEGLVGEAGEVIDTLNPMGRVMIGGEYWNANTDGETIEKGEQVEVISAGRLILKVRKK